MYVLLMYPPSLRRWPTVSEGAASPRTDITLSANAHISWPYVREAGDMWVMGDRGEVLVE